MRLHKKALGVFLCVMFLLSAGTAKAAPGHSTTLNWIASVDMPTTIPTGSGYNVFRASGACPATGAPTGATQLNSTPVAANTYLDGTPTPGQWCYYVVTSLNGATSVPSANAGATTPVAPPTNVIITNQQ